LSHPYDETYRNAKAPMIENTVSTMTPRAYHALLRPTSSALSCLDEASKKRLHLDLVVIVLALISVAVMSAFDFSVCTFSILVRDFDNADLSTSSENDMIEQVRC
jgi:hypothetical protein